MRIVKLARAHNVDDFDCGEPALDRFLERFAFWAQRSDASQTYVALDDDRVVGFSTLVVGEVGYDDAPERLRKGLARYPVPVMILARLAVSRHRQGRSIGSTLIKDAMYRTLAAADIAGIRAMIVHAKNEPAHTYYRRFGFVDVPGDGVSLYLLLTDIRKQIAINPPA